MLTAGARHVQRTVLGAAQTQSSTFPGRSSGFSEINVSARHRTPRPSRRGERYRAVGPPRLITADGACSSSGRRRSADSPRALLLPHGLPELSPWRGTRPLQWSSRPVADQAHGGSATGLTREGWNTWLSLSNSLPLGWRI